MAKTKAAAKHAMPPLDRPVEAYWAEYKQQPSEDIRNILIEHYLPQVKSVAQRIHARLPNEVDKRTQCLSVFLVDMRESLGKGLEIRPIDAMINHNSTEVFFDNLEIPAANLIGQEGEGFRYILDGMNAERILIAAESIGDGRWFLDKAVAYANTRQVFGRSIGKNQGVQFPLARAYAELEAADLMCRRAAALFDAGQPCGPDANMAKMLAAEAGWHAGEAAMQTHGGFAFAREYDIERKWRDLPLYQIAAISSNMILAYLAQHVLGMERSY